MTKIEFDLSELNEFAADIVGADARVRRNVVKAVKTSAFLWKKLWRESARSHIVHGSLRQYDKAIDYDVEGIGAGNRSGEISAEIGPTLGGQGSLGIVEETPRGVRGKPQRNREKIEQPLTEDFVRGMLAAVGDDGLGDA